MDPQQRLLLRDLLGGAGARPGSTRGRCAAFGPRVFVGAYSSGYAPGVAGQDAAALEGHLITGNATSVISGQGGLRAGAGRPRR